MHVLKKLQGYFKSAQKVLEKKFQKCSKEVSRLFQGSFNKVSKGFQSSFNKGVSRKLCFLILHGTYRSYPSRRRACFSWKAPLSWTSCKSLYLCVSRLKQYEDQRLLL